MSHGGKSTSDKRLSHTVRARIDAVCDQYEGACIAGQRPRIEDYLREWQEPERTWLVHELVLADLEYQKNRGQAPSRDEYVRRFPDQAGWIDSLLVRAELPATRSVARMALVDPVNSPGDVESPPEKIGRYVVRQLVDSGGFGNVFRAYDETLRREVAIKIPRRDSLSAPDDVASFLSEARTVARLRHPHIVAVHDAGQLNDGRCFVVSDFIEGDTLAKKIALGRLSHRAAAELVATIGEALHFAHQQKIIHRDVKPSNILIDAADKPSLVDFGLALREDDFGSDHAQGMTPAYTSPEQARGEGHLVDGRADIFSLGVVLYELLTGERPFIGKDLAGLLERIGSAKIEARPPRQIDPTIPIELERICLKALSKRIGDRYTTAYDMSADLRQYLAGLDEPRPVPNDSAWQTRTAWLVGAICLAALLVGLPFTSFWRPAAPLVGNNDEPTSIIRRMDVLHILDEGPIRHSLLEDRENYRPPRERDHVRIEAEFARRADCRLIAVNPDRTVQLWYPQHGESEAITRLSFPADPRDAIALTDGPGQQIFMLVASPSRLSHFENWREKIARELEPTEPPDSGTWLYRQGAMVPLGQTRGEVRKLPAGSTFEAVCRTVRQLAAEAEIEAVSFQVEPHE